MNARRPFDRLRVALALGVTLAIGVASRRIHLGWHAWDKSLGDVLYAIAMYLGLAFVWPRMDSRACGRVTFGVCFAIELFQITGIPIALARTRPWVHWILGGAFGWDDVICYAVGAVAITLVAPILSTSPRSSTWRCSRNCSCCC